MRDAGVTVKDGKQYFTLTDRHLALLKRANVDWDDGEFGAPAIDCKRPYGNSDVLDDLADILGLEQFEDRHGDTHLNREQEDLLVRLHRETQTALQIVLSRIGLPVSPGTYAADQYDTFWEPAHGSV